MAARSVDGASLLAELDEAQRQAALALVGPVGILAGAGSGKTRTIAHRIAYGVRTGVYDPDRVLALTFTTRAAGELRGRLHALAAPTVQARTFHSAALRQLSYFWPHTIGGSLPKVIASKSRMLTLAAERARIRLSVPVARAIAEEIEWRKVTERSIEQYSRTIDTGERPAPGGLGTAEVVALMTEYEQAKDSERLLDFEDVLLATVGMLETEPWVTQQVREQYRFFTVDEYQDVNPLQQRLLELWLGGRRELCVVGDPAQTIYSFTGASRRYLIDFERTHPDARIVELRTNYRSTPAIIDVANALADRIPASLHLEPAIEPSRRAVPAVHVHDDDAQEADSIAATLEAALAAGEAAADMAVLVRTNAQLAVLEQALQARGLPYRTSGSRPFFTRPDVQAAVAALRAAVVAGQDSGPLFRTVSDVVRGRGWTVEPPPGTGPEREAWSALDALVRLADQAPAGTSAAEFTADLERRRRMQHEPVLDAIVLTTIHSAKGLEWPRVIVSGLREGLLPLHAAVDQGEEGIDEERRLFYVAITRARTRLELHWSPGPRGAAPSRFLAELGNRIQGGSRGAATTLPGPSARSGAAAPKATRR